MVGWLLIERYKAELQLCFVCDRGLGFVLCYAVFEQPFGFFDVSLFHHRVAQTEAAFSRHRTVWVVLERSFEGPLGELWFGFDES